MFFEQKTEEAQIPVFFETKTVLYASSVHFPIQGYLKSQVGMPPKARVPSRPCLLEHIETDLVFENQNP